MNETPATNTERAGRRSGTNEGRTRKEPIAKGIMEGVTIRTDPVSICSRAFGVVDKQHRNVKTGNKGWGTKTHRKNFAESLSRQQWGGEGKTPPKAARIRHPKIPPLNYAARGEESLRQGATKKQNVQSTNSIPSLTGWRVGGLRTKKADKALPTFSKRMDETFSTPLADQQQKKHFTK
ncbi:hypothetical protein TNCV_2624941 [Trichonephila clavipes]|nr:hypothetical protein TNCV_2624941 [Trichonephila clavipes]